MPDQPYVSAVSEHEHQFAGNPDTGVVSCIQCGKRLARTAVSGVGSQQWKAAAFDRIVAAREAGDIDSTFSAVENEIDQFDGSAIIGGHHPYHENVERAFYRTTVEQGHRVDCAKNGCATRHSDDGRVFEWNDHYGECPREGYVVNGHATTYVERTLTPWGEPLLNTRAVSGAHEYTIDQYDTYCKICGLGPADHESGTSE